MNHLKYSLPSSSLSSLPSSSSLPSPSLSSSSLSLKEALEQINELKNEVNCLTGVINIMKEDLQVKDEQFDYLYASIKARSEQYLQSKKNEDEHLRARLHQLDIENDYLQIQLRTATRKLNLLTWKNASKCSSFLNIPDDIICYVIDFLQPIELARFMCTCRHSHLMGSRGKIWKTCFIRDWGEKEAKSVWNEYLTQCESNEFPLTDNQSDIWRILYGRIFMINSNWRKGKGYMHICRGHTGTVTCLALPETKQSHNDNNNYNNNNKSSNNYLFSGSDDGSILLWNLNPPSQNTHHIHGKKKNGNSRNGSLTQSPPLISTKSSPNDSDLPNFPLLPPPNLPLAQLVEGRRSGRPISSSRRFQGAGAELHCLSTSPDYTLKNFLTSTKDSNIEINFDNSNNNNNNNSNNNNGIKSIQPISFPIIRPNAPSILRSNFHGHGGPIWTVDYDEETNQLFSGSYDQTIKIWDASTGLCQSTLRGHTGWISSLAILKREEIQVTNNSGNTITETSGRLLSASWDATVKLWNTSTGDVLTTISSGARNALYCMSVLFESPNSNQNAIFAVGCRQCEVQEWSLQTNQRIFNYLGHSKEVHSVVLSHSLCISGSGDHSIKVWDRRSGMCIQTLNDHKGSVMALQYDENANRLISGSYDKSVKIWDMRWYSTNSTSSSATTITSTTPLATINVEHPVFCLKSNKTQLIVGSTDHSFRVFDFSHYK